MKDTSTAEEVLEMKLPALKALAKTLGVQPEKGLDQRCKTTWLVTVQDAMLLHETIVPDEAKDDSVEFSTPLKAAKPVKLEPQTSEKPVAEKKPQPEDEAKKTWQELALAEGMRIDDKLYRVVDEKDPLLIAMRQDDEKKPAATIIGFPKEKVPTGIRLPIYRPLVTASFAARNLSGNPKEGIKATNSIAGRDPWAICDYLRDSLQWPASLIFIDSEQTGNYDLDHYHLNEMFMEDEQSPHDDECTTTSKGKKNPLFRQHDGSRNWKKVFTWAQAGSHVMLYFMSENFFESENCLNEFKDYCGLLCEKKAKAVPVIALLDAGQMKKACKFMNEMALSADEAGWDREDWMRTFNTRNIFDLSEYMLWKTADDEGTGGQKRDLKAASRQIQSLRDCISRFCGGRGDSEVYIKDMEQGLRCQDLIDDGGNPMRNRYKQDERRVDINKADEAELTRRLPNCGKGKADKIVAQRRALRVLKTVDDLFEVSGGECVYIVLMYIMMFDTVHSLLLNITLTILLTTD